MMPSTRISSERASRGAIGAGQRRAGATLFELLVVLAILASVSLVSASILSANAPERALDAAARMLVVDLKHARLKAEIEGAPVVVAGRRSGYGIPAADIEREFRRGVEARWNGAVAGEIVFGTSPRAADIELAMGGAVRRVSVAAMTGQVAHD